ncbi:hypothetical protein ACKWTF_008117 [Chironomus riparius]
MVHSVSIVFALIVNLVFRQYFFDTDYKFGTLSGFSSLLMLFSTSIHIKNINILPEHHKKISQIIYVMIEIILVLISLEISVNLMWMRLQILIEFIMKYLLMDNKLNLYQEMGGDSLLGFIILSIAIYFLYYSLMITSNSGILKIYAEEFVGKFQNKQIEECAINSVYKPETVTRKLTRNSRSIKPPAH